MISEVAVQGPIEATKTLKDTGDYYNQRRDNQSLYFEKKLKVVEVDTF